jgi:pectate lyase
VEGNYFEQVEEPMTNRYAGPQGRIVQRSNTFVSSGSPVVGGSVQEPSLFYSYTLDNSADVKTIVMQGAGGGTAGLLRSLRGVAVFGDTLRPDRLPRRKREILY